MTRATAARPAWSAWPITRAQASARLDAAAWAYCSNGAADDDHAAHANRSAWDALALRPRVLRPLGGLSLAGSLLGQSMPCPMLVAPMAHQRLAHPDGELATAVAAAAVGVGVVLSQQSNTRWKRWPGIT